MASDDKKATRRAETIALLESLPDFKNGAMAVPTDTSPMTKPMKADLEAAMQLMMRANGLGALDIAQAIATARAEEREACARVAQDRAEWCRKEHQNGAHFDTLHAHERSAEVVAGRIRARGGVA